MVPRKHVVHLIKMCQLAWKAWCWVDSEQTLALAQCTITERKKWRHAPLGALSPFPLGKRHLQIQLRHKIFPWSVKGMMNNPVVSIVCVLPPSLCVTYCRQKCLSRATQLGEVWCSLAAQLDSQQGFHIIFSELLNSQFCQADLHIFPILFSFNAGRV